MLGNCEFFRGTLSSGNITNKVRGESWTLTDTGNWEEYKIDENGDGEYGDDNDLDQNRTHNLVNEIYNATAGSAITEEYGPQSSWADPVYSARGNMTTIPKPTDLEYTYSASYDAWNRLAEVKSGETVVARYEYDPYGQVGLGRRVKKHIDTQAPASPNGVDTYRHFYYGGWTSASSVESQVVEMRESASENTEPQTLKPQYQYVWSLRYIDAPVLRDENKDDDDECADANDQRLYYTTDANMNVTCLTDENGDAVERYHYDPYGNVTIYDDDWSETRSSSSYDNNILYCRYYRDGETGLYHVRYRMYHPSLGRWLTRDPIGYIDGMSLYEYCGSEPMSYVDPSGLLWTDEQDQIQLEVMRRLALRGLRMRGQILRDIRLKKLILARLLREGANQVTLQKIKQELRGLRERLGKLAAPTVNANHYVDNHDAIAKLEMEMAVDAVTVTEEGLKMLPGGEAGYQLSEGNYGKAALAYGIDVAGSAGPGLLGKG
ncbi:MAG: RHS repeat-associated core domain-containing protein, partial [Planctomycetota bacterium]|nr:RHS repeat-associated core domain-containing protein [Planctomycetota bacterium]